MLNSSKQRAERKGIVKNQTKKMAFFTVFSSSSSSSSSSSCCARPYLFNSSAFPLQSNLLVSSSAAYLKKASLFTSIKTPATFHNTINLSISNSSRSSQPLCCRAAAKQQTSTAKNRNNSRKKTTPKKKKVTVKDIEKDDDSNVGDETSEEAYQPSAIPQPPAGFVIDSSGKVLMASSKRIATIVDSTNNLPLECIIRRVFRSSKGDQCLLLCPVDMPVQIVKSTNIEGWSALDDEEVDAILPAAAYALAKIQMHLVSSGFCYTARGGFCYSEGDIFEFSTDDGQSIDGVPTEAVEITCFHQEGIHYMLYTPSDPLLFVAVRDTNGVLQIADDDLLDDPAILSAIDEETEFNALVEEEAALLEALLGKEL